MNNKLSFLSRKDMKHDTKELVEEVLRLLELKGVTNVHINVFFEYAIKVENMNTEKNNRRYYAHNTSLDGISDDRQVIDNILRCKDATIEEKATRNIKNDEDRKRLRRYCTEIQQNRYIKHVYYGLSYTEIAKQENVSEGAIRNSIRKVYKKLNQ